MRLRLFDSTEAIARQKAFRKICEQCTEALAVLERMRAAGGGAASDDAAYMASMQETCDVMACPAADLKCR